MKDLCKFKDSLGKPREGVHSYRIFDIAILDVLGTILLGYLTHLLFPNITVWQGFVIWFLLAIILHWLFCVDTTLIKLLRLN